MKRINFQLFAMGIALALSDAATAETGVGYSINVEGEQKTMADGTFVRETTADDIWLIDNQPEGFASKMVASCSAIWVMGADYSNKGSTFRCTAKDSDGDGYISVGHIREADWTGCGILTVASWGKYAGAKLNGTCQVGGPFAGEDTGTYTWTGEWTLPQ
jgi:hypothetical protein